MPIKYYVVWEGRETGVFEEWERCKAAIYGQDGAMYKCFYSLEAAQKAYEEGFEHYWGRDVDEDTLFEHQGLLVGEPAEESICVDVSWHQIKSRIAYRGVETSSGRELFAQGPFAGGTILAGEYLAIVHALAYLKKVGSPIPVYTESRYALGWIRAKGHCSNLLETPANYPLRILLERADRWLHANTFQNPILKWEAKVWGKNPASY